MGRKIRAVEAPRALSGFFALERRAQNDSKNKNEEQKQRQRPEADSFAALRNDKQKVQRAKYGGLSAAAAKCAAFGRDDGWA
jgi:hypothetical protein